MTIAASTLALLTFTIHHSLFAIPAAAAPSVTDGGAENNFPDGITFRVAADSDSTIEEVRLRYKVLPDGASSRAVPDFEPGAHVDAEFQLEGNTNSYLPPGVEVEYHWEVTDATGATAETEPQTFFYEDARFDWASVDGGGVTIYYYSGSADDAEAMHDVAVGAIDSMSQLLGTDVPFTVLVWTYASKDDMRPALRRTSPTRDSQVITAGASVASNIVLVLGNASFDTLRHELTHIVTKQAGESALGSLPWWLDEGTAVYGQSDPGGFGDAIQSAISSGDVFSVREISAFPGDPDNVRLFYGEAWSVVNFLVDEYGEAKFAELFATVKSGKRIGSALDAVYGFDEDGLENAWRTANGLPTREASEATDDAQQGIPSTDTSEDSGGATTGAVIAIALGIIALAAVVGVGGIILARRVI